MTWVYAVTLTVGVVALLSWIVVQAVRSEPASSAAWEVGIAAAVAFGLGGMSAKFAGWPVVAHLAASLAAGAAAATYTYWLNRRRAA